MHDTLDYLKEEPRHRKFHQEKLTFRPMYAFSENFMLPLSHDEVVHGKGSLLTKMPGDDDWEQFANLRLLYAYMWGQPGKKLLFMGGEIAQRPEWDHDQALEWFVLDEPLHKGIQDWVRDLNRFYKSEAASHEKDFTADGFEWVNCRNTGTNVLSFLRKGEETARPLLLVYNFSTELYRDFRVGVPIVGRWDELLNSDSDHYGGRGEGNLGGADAEDVPCDEHPYSLSLTLPALGALFFGAASERPKRTTIRRK